MLRPQGAVVLNCTSLGDRGSYTLRATGAELNLLLTSAAR